MKKNAIYKNILAVSIVSALTACGGDDNENPPADPPADPPANTVSLSGSVSAVNGQVAFHQPDFSEKILAMIIGKSSQAGVDGESPVGAGITIELVEVDASGNQVDDVIASGVTDSSGDYAIEAPEGFTPGPQYVLRAVAGSVSLEARVDTLTPSVNSITDVASNVISGNAMDLTALTVGEIEEITAAVSDVVEDTAASSAGVDDFRSAIVTATAENESVSNVISSTTAGGQICGTVTDSDGAPLENIRMIVRDFGNWVTRAKTKTDASGNYCINAPVAGDADQYIAGRTHSGEYILGALNYTSASFAASQWWTSTSDTANGSGGANSQFKAEKVAVADTNTVTKDFVLDKNGARIEGTVMGDSDGDTVGDIAMEGMSVLIRNYDTFKPLAGARVKADGSYRINVKAADYMLSYRNKSRRPFASEVYRAGTDGAVNRNMASRESVIANQSNVYDVVLAPGVVVSGEVLDNTGTAVAGEVVYINNLDGGRIEAMRTNKNGQFRLWVNPRIGLAGAPYIIRTRGQALNADTNGIDDNTTTSFDLNSGAGLTFDAQTRKVSGRLISAGTSSVPVGSAVVFLTSASGTFAVSAADGTFALYTSTPATNHILSLRMDSDTNYGSGVLSGSSIQALARASGTPIDLSSVDVDLGDITMPTLGEGAGVGYLVGQAGAGSTVVTIRMGGTNNSFDMVSTRARGDGSFNMTVPATTYDRVRSKLSGGVNNNGVNCNAITVNNGVTTTVDYTLSGCTVN